MEKGKKGKRKDERKVMQKGSSPIRGRGLAFDDRRLRRIPSVPALQPKPEEENRAGYKFEEMIVLAVEGRLRNSNHRFSSAAKKIEDRALKGL